MATHGDEVVRCEVCMEPATWSEEFPWPICESEECRAEAWRTLHPEDGYDQSWDEEPSPRPPASPEDERGAGE